MSSFVINVGLGFGVPLLHKLYTSINEFIHKKFFLESYDFAIKFNLSTQNQTITIITTLI